jgi:hypothetical protein
MLVKFYSKFSILATDALEVGQQTTVLLKRKGRELITFPVKSEKSKSKRIV